MKKRNKKNSRFDFNLIGILAKSKRSQAWGMDLVIALAIFSVGLVAFYIYSLNAPSEAKEVIDSLFYDGKIIANSILSEGYPINWNLSNVVTLGILSENKINETKLRRFYNLTQTNYPKTKIFLTQNMIISLF